MWFYLENNKKNRFDFHVVLEIFSEIVFSVSLPLEFLEKKRAPRSAEMRRDDFGRNAEIRRDPPRCTEMISGISRNF